MENNKITYNPVELSKALGIGRNAAYSLCHRADFPAIRIGKTFIIPKDALLRWMEQQCQLTGGEE